MLPQAPQVRILDAMKADGESVDYLEDAGIQARVKIRHKRKREPVRGDRPCHTLIFVVDEYQQGETGFSQDEIVRLMTVDLQTDIDVDPQDVTGLDTLTRAQAAFLRRLRQPDSQTLQLVDWVTEGDIEPEDRAPAEDGRLTRSLVLQYRVLATDGNVLLAAGENA